MYTTCIFCSRPLGENDTLEAFPTGTRLAFDPVKGRLWVVCRTCERWNLSPLEERWEAIEDAERLFRGTRTRVSTENIGFAHLGGGLELVRIGKPLRPEFAAWRYGDQFGRRRRRALITGSGAAVVVGAFVVAGAATGVVGTVLWQSSTWINLWVNNARTVLSVRRADGTLLKLKLPDLNAGILARGADGECGLSLGRNRQHVFTGAEAERVLGLVMPMFNSSGARATQVQDAVRQIDQTGGPTAYLSSVGRWAPYNGVGWRGEGPELTTLTRRTKLALEMALHEEQERRALEGELKGLELAWRTAEEVAAIADDLLLPDEVQLRMSAAESQTIRNAT
ncbi:MAG TPA: hypothetical protein VK912_03500 [Longimicrobiales bacterium]|nr:hypothetical protein [Longimicrobiales bacterium]